MKNTVVTIQQMKEKGEKISMLTAYDYSTAKLEDEAGVNTILVGDSLGNVILGYEDTISVTMEDMIHHGAAVARGAKNALVVVDMPFMSYQTSVYDAVVNAGRLMKEGRAGAVKLEGGKEVCPQIQAIVGAGIPVCAHLGLTPQSINAFGGFKVQGKTEKAAKKLIADAIAVEEAGAFAVVLEGIPSKLANLVTEKLDIPTIGIGAGNGCGGQVLVYQDMLGMFSDFTPKFVKRYANIGEVMKEAFQKYMEEIQSGAFPSSEHEYKIDDDIIEKLYEEEEKMQIVSTVEEVRKQVKKWREEGLSVGLVPTMGYLHEGHKSLIDKAVEQNDRVVVSVFVNPIQFGPNEDLATYPRDLERDAALCENAGANLIFHPEPENMYESDFCSFIDMDGLTKGLCGKTRPTHFRGVCTVVGKLFNIVEPDRAYFGQKDAQQLAVIRRMVRDLNFNLEVIGCPIIREDDGLAKSSRNTYLSKEERKAAVILHKGLLRGEELVKAGEKSAATVKQAITEIIESEPLAKIDYVEIVNFDNIETIETINGSILAAVAVYIGKTRLIDNFIYES